MVLHFRPLSCTRVLSINQENVGKVAKNPPIIDSGIQFDFLLDQFVSDHAKITCPKMS